MKKILFIGTTTGNSFLELLVLKKFFKRVDKIDVEKIFFFKKIVFRIFHHISPYIFEHHINKYILKRMKKNYDLIYVRSGEFISKHLIIELKKKTEKIVFNCDDNPFVKRDKQRWKLFLPAARYYDLLIFQQESRIKLSKKLGLKNLFLTLPPYDKNVHKKKVSLKTKKKMM